MDLLPIDHTLALPPELFADVLAGFTFEQLLPVLAVCARWRQIALDQPVYWASVELKSPTESAANLFLTRLSRSKGRPLKLFIDLAETTGGFSAMIMPGVLNHLRHITSLDISLPAATVGLLLQTLVVEAPLLSSIRVSASYETGTPLPGLPANLFDGRSPGLRSVALRNVIIRGKLLIPAFKTVSQVELSFRPDQSPLPTVFNLFPAMTCLEWMDPMWLDDPLYYDASSWHSIHWLSWDSCRGATTPSLPTSAVDSVHRVDTCRPTAAEFEALLLPLKRDLNLICTYGGSGVDFSLWFIEDGDGRARHMTDEWEPWKNDSALGLRAAFAACLADRIRKIDITVALWGDFTAILVPLPNLHTLTLRLADGDNLSELAGAGVLHCPALQCVELFSPNVCRWLQVEDVAAFIRAALDAPEPQLPRLMRMNVHILGPGDDYLMRRDMPMQLTRGNHDAAMITCTGVLAPCLKKLTLFGASNEPCDPEIVTRLLCTLPAKELELYTRYLRFTPELLERLSAAQSLETVAGLKLFHGWTALSTRDMFSVFSLMPNIKHLAIADTLAYPYATRRDYPDAANWYVEDAGSLDTPAFQLRSYTCNHPFVGWYIPVQASARTLLSLDVISELNKPEELAALAAVSAQLESLTFSVNALPEQVISALAACSRLRILGMYIDKGFTASRMLVLFDALVTARCRLKGLVLRPYDRNNVDAVSAVYRWRLLDLCAALRAVQTLAVDPYTGRTVVPQMNADSLNALIQLQEYSSYGIPHSAELGILEFVAGNRSELPPSYTRRQAISELSYVLSLSSELYDAQIRETPTIIGNPLVLAPVLSSVELGPYYAHPATLAALLLRVLTSTPTRFLQLRAGILWLSPADRDALRAAAPFAHLRLLMVPHGTGMLPTRDLFFLFTLMPALQRLWVCTKDMIVPGFWDDAPQDGWYARPAELDTLPRPAFSLLYYRCETPFPGWTAPMLHSSATLRELEIGWELDDEADVAAVARVAPRIHALDVHVDEHLALMLPALPRFTRLRRLKIFVGRRGFTSDSAEALFTALSHSGCRLITLDLDPAPSSVVLRSFARLRLLERHGCLHALRDLMLTMWSADAEDMQEELRELRLYCLMRRVRLLQAFFDSLQFDGIHSRPLGQSTRKYYGLQA
ncbi:hypothetical protein AURDEDRAFT_124069 [Auricularia subglabra TFB-10046 SS5]|nr:hypothetical protein AURDEDRAFT_124069 [Auricularia subglabra TFB-10046 SS5]